MNFGKPKILQNDKQVQSVLKLFLILSIILKCICNIKWGEKNYSFKALTYVSLDGWTLHIRRQHMIHKVQVCVINQKFEQWAVLIHSMGYQTPPKNSCMSELLVVHLWVMLRSDAVGGWLLNENIGFQMK